MVHSLEHLERPVDLVSLDPLDLEGVVHSLEHLERLVDLVSLGLLDRSDISHLVLMGSLDRLVSLVLEPSFQVVCK